MHKELDFAEHSAKFKHIDGGLLLELSDQDLVELGIEKPIDRKVLLREIKKLRGNAGSGGGTSRGEPGMLSTASSSGDEPAEEEHQRLQREGMKEAVTEFATNAAMNAAGKVVGVLGEKATSAVAGLMESDSGPDNPILQQLQGVADIAIAATVRCAAACTCKAWDASPNRLHPLLTLSMVARIAV